MAKTQNEKPLLFLSFMFLNFEFVSDFDIRISNLNFSVFVSNFVFQIYRFATGEKMKYITLVLSLFLIAGCAHTSITTAPVDIVGLWKGEFNNPMGGPPTRMAFKFIRDGGSIGGVMRNESIQGEWDQLENLKMHM